jgi:cytochrome c oxidase subunit 2
VKLNLTNTADVSHGFWIPALGIDKEMAPEVTSAVDVTPSKLGTFPGACNVECGRGMAGMNFTVQVVSEADFLTYLSSL